MLFSNSYLVCTSFSSVSTCFFNPERSRMCPMEMCKRSLMSSKTSPNNQMPQVSNNSTAVSISSCSRNDDDLNIGIIIFDFLQNLLPSSYHLSDNSPRLPHRDFYLMLPETSAPLLKGGDFEVWIQPKLVNQ